MDFIHLLKKDLLYYRRTNLTLIGLAAVCCAILTGALLVGDSVKFSLARINQMRLGHTQLAMTTGDKYFRIQLADELAKSANVIAAPVLMQKGMLESADGTVRINDLNIYGVDDSFWALAFSKVLSSGFERDTILISCCLADRLKDAQADLLLRFKQDESISRDLVFSKDKPGSKAWSVKLAGTLSDEAMGRFSLTAVQQAPLNVFVPIAWLAEKTGLPGKANTMLIAAKGKGPIEIEKLNAHLHRFLTLDDLQLKLKTIESAGVIELSSPEIFINTEIGQSAFKAGPNGFGVLTYFVNDIICKDKSVPYSMISSLSAAPNQQLKDDEIIINEWLARELNADPGDKVTLRYYKPAASNKLIEETSGFTIRSVVPMMGSFADPTLMPSFPGLSDVENCRDWDSGVPVDLSKIQPRDEAYWNKYKGTPKAFISLNKAADIWGNRFGSFTAVRWPADESSIDALKKDLINQIDPANLGFVFADVQSVAKLQSSGSSDFAGLFVGLSMFLIFSAVILLALVFIFYIGSRLQQAGLFSAIGWDRPSISALFIFEGAVLAGIGCLIGAILSIIYTNVLAAFLNSSFWAGAVASLEIVSRLPVWTLIKGALLSFIICMLATLLALKRSLNKPAHNLLTLTSNLTSKSNLFSGRLILPAIFIFVGVIIPFFGSLISQSARFFLSGVLLLSGSILAVRVCLSKPAISTGIFARSQTQLALKNILRRKGRSLAVLTTAACGVFLVISVGANRKDIAADLKERSSGTGGFTLIAQTTLPMTQAPLLDADKGLQMPGIEQFKAVAFKVYQQEDASCLNLNRVMRPTVLGVDPAELSSRKSFSFKSELKAEGFRDWQLLNVKFDNNEIPVIGDYATIFWSLKKNVGDTLAYQTEAGSQIILKIAGVLTDSLLQGKLIVSQTNFERMFPSVDGYGIFLLDADVENSQLQAQQLSKKYRDYGMEVTGAAQKLLSFHEVENTYLSIFLGLGGMGLLLGSAGVGLVLVLNVFDRRGELAMMDAVGFRRQDLQYMLFVEHGVVLAAGVLCGLVPALIAIMPALCSQGQNFSAWPLFLLVVGLIVSGAVWIKAAIWGVLRMNFLEVLKNE